MDEKSNAPIRKVTPGRIVMFDDGRNDDEDAAIVKRVNEDGTINLHVFGHEGPFEAYNVPPDQWFFPARVNDAPVMASPIASLATNAQTVTQQGETQSGPVRDAQGRFQSSETD